MGYGVSGGTARFDTSSARLESTQPRIPHTASHILS